MSESFGDDHLSMTLPALLAIGADPEATDGFGETPRRKLMGVRQLEAWDNIVGAFRAKRLAESLLNAHVTNGRPSP